jgi:hypothetical protein
MYSFMEKLMSTMYPTTKPIIPTKSIYEQRIDCLKSLISLQEQIKSTDEEYFRISSIEGKAHKNAYERLEGLTSEYRKEYKFCEKIINY